MKQKNLPSLLFVLTALFICNETKAQLSINSATFFIQPGATVTVQGDVTSNVDIQGSGKVLLNGSTNQNINMGGTVIQNLEINNSSNATLASNAKVGKSLTFTNGKITLGANNFILSDSATTFGQGTGKFLETNSTGQVVKQLIANVTSYEV